MTRYPAPPWPMEGWALFAPLLVRAADVRLPPGFSLESTGGFSIGLLGVVDYRAPSPLAYRELVWMPGRVRAERRDGRPARGYWVAKMLVDDAASLAGGRELWALPKQMARFSLGEREARIESDDGARLTLSLGPRRGPALPAKSAVVTLQRGEGELVRFRGEGRARVALRSLRVASSEGLDDSWRSLATARPLGPLGVELRHFRASMRPAERLR